MNNSADLSTLFEKGKEMSMLESIKKMEQNLSMYDSKIGNLNQEKQTVIKNILECLSKADSSTVATEYGGKDLVAWQE